MPEGVLRLRFRPRHPRPAAPRGPARGVHPRVAGRAGRPAARAGRPSRARLIVLTPWPATTSCAGPRAGGAGRLHRPRLRAPGHRTRPPGAHSAGRGRASRCTPSRTMVFEGSEVLTQTGTPYTVFTPYKNAWLRKIDAFYLKSYPVERHAGRLAPRPEAHRRAVPGFQALGSSPQGCRNWPACRGPAARSACSRIFASASRAMRTHATFRPSRGRAT